MCGSEVNENASECPSCGEQFAPLEENGIEDVPEFIEETTIEETDELEVLPPEDDMADLPPEEMEGETLAPDGEISGDELDVPPDEYEEETFEEEVIEDIKDCNGCGEPLPPEATECPGCGMEIEEVIEDIKDCIGCGEPLPPDVTECPECGMEIKEEPEIQPSEVGCPICGDEKYSVESGDLVSCDECGNVYIKKEYVAPPPQKWKWKFWVGLIFIIIGDLGVALGSYVHNVVFDVGTLGTLYLGYGWIDQMVGITGIVLFIVGLILFSWSFKRDREVECPSCKIVLTEGEFIPFDEEEDEEEIDEDEAIESAMEEIDEAGECPHCGATVSIYDEVCPNCETPLEIREDIEEIEEILEEEGLSEEIQTSEVAIPPETDVEKGPVEFVPASELDETQMVLDSLELLEDISEEEEQPLEDENGMKALQELEAEFELSSPDEAIGDEEIPCQECGMLIPKGSDPCPICGAAIEGGE